MCARNQTSWLAQTQANGSGTANRARRSHGKGLVGSQRGAVCTTVASSCLLVLLAEAKPARPLDQMEDCMCSLALLQIQLSPHCRLALANPLRVYEWSQDPSASVNVCLKESVITHTLIV